MENVESAKPTRPDLLFADECYRIKGACMAVHEALGCGFIEKVYENALAHELRKRGFNVVPQAPMQVFYDGLLVGDFAVDLLIDGKLVIEVKATERDNPVFTAQVINYLKASGLPLGLLVNFGMPFFQFDRIVFTKQTGAAGPGVSSGEQAG